VKTEQEKEGGEGGHMGGGGGEIEERSGTVKVLKSSSVIVLR